MIKQIKGYFRGLFSSEVPTQEELKPLYPSISQLEHWYGVNLSCIQDELIVSEKHVTGSYGNMRTLFTTDKETSFGFYRYNREWKVKIIDNK